MRFSSWPWSMRGPTPRAMTRTCKNGLIYAEKHVQGATGDSAGLHLATSRSGAIVQKKRVGRRLHRGAGQSRAESLYGKLWGVPSSGADGKRRGTGTQGR